MKNFLLILIVVHFTTFSAQSQTVVISDNATYSGNTSSLLDIHSASGNLGLLIPQVDLSSTTDQSTISSPANGLMVFNKGANIDEGLYFWSSADNKWKFIYSGNVPSFPGNVIYWVRPTDAKYIQPEYNVNAKIFDAGQNYAFYYEGTNKHGSFFAGEDVGVIGQRAGSDTSDVPLFTNDIYPFIDMYYDADITSDDEVTYSGIYAYGELYNGVTGISKWDAGIRGIGLATFEYDNGWWYSIGTNRYWPVVGVMGEVLDVGYSDYGQQAVYGWQAAPGGSDDYCIGVIGKTSQSGYRSSGTAGYYSSNPGNLVSQWGGKDPSIRSGYLGTANWGVYSQGNMGAYGNIMAKEGGFISTNGFTQLVKTSKGNTKFYSPTATQQIVEDYGSAALVNGVATVKIDQTLLEVISDADYQVFIQMTGNYQQEVFVVKNKGYFVVKQKNNGQDNVTFDWHIVAKQKNAKTSKYQTFNNFDDLFWEPTPPQKKEHPHIKKEK